jgi:2-amino-4-hydroxy-6-hydroxymethyldihydropteridine diphosphokinase
LILFGDQTIQEPGLTVPHPRFRERLFVLEPLAEVAPGWIDPGTGLAISELLARARRAPPGPS